MKKQRFHFLFWLMLSTLFLSGCYINVDNWDPDNEYIYITEILIENESDPYNGRMEIEVHLIDANTERLIACSGHEDGLRHVDRSDVFYETNARLYSHRYNDYLTPEDLEGRDVYLMVIEKDSEPCPAPFDPLLDDILGISRIFPGENLYRERDMSFGQVAHLRIGAH